MEKIYTLKLKGGSYFTSGGKKKHRGRCGANSWCPSGRTGHQLYSCCPCHYPLWFGARRALGSPAHTCPTAVLTSNVQMQPCEKVASLPSHRLCLLHCLNFGSGSLCSALRPCLWACSVIRRTPAHNIRLMQPGPHPKLASPRR